LAILNSPTKQPSVPGLLPQRSKKKLSVLPDKVVVSDEQTLEMLQKRLQQLVEDYNIKAAEQNTPREELERLEVQINITRQFLIEKKRQIRAKTKQTEETKSSVISEAPEDGSASPNRVPAKIWKQDRRKSVTN
jgi:septal ring factor EnvC (AmiA/AmiB activator)